MGRRKITATIFDTEGYPFITFSGSSPQDVGDAASIYVLNVANPLGGDVPQFDLVQRREEEL